MKILYVANIRMPTEKAHGLQIMKACEAFKNAGADIELLVSSRKSALAEEPFEYYGIENKFPIKKLFTLDTVAWGRLGFIFQSLLFAFAAQSELKKDPAAVVYGRDEIVLAALVLLTGRNVFWESHDGAWNIWSRFLARRARGIITVTKGAVDFYSQKGIDGAKLLSVPNGIHLEDFAGPESKEDARARLGLPPGKTIAMYTGKIGGWKGVDTLLDASKLLPEHIIVAIVGGEEDQIQKLRPRYSKVIFLGRRPYGEMKDNQAAADMLILPNTAKDATSVTFTSPLKLFSYMASKRPIIASDLPSIREVIDDDTAVFFKPDEPQDLAQAITFLSGNAEVGTTVADRAYTRVLGYTWKARAAKILSYIEKKS